MNEGLISRRYAKAILTYSAERGEDKALYDRMRTLTRNITAVPRLREVLANPVVHREDKANLIYDAAGSNVEESFTKFIGLVLDNHRETLLQDIALSYMTMFRRAYRISVVTLTSTVPLSGYILERVKLDVERRTHGTVEFDTHIDESIKGGFIFQIDDLRLDASITGQLERIKQQLIRKNKMIV